ncbi:MAG: MDR family NADPH-dependent oxidoreductase [Akkermansiaceae bacterium]
MPASTNFASFGQPTEVVELVEVPPRELEPGELRLQMLYAPINPADINYIQGVYGIKPELPATPGLEGCGRVMESHSQDFQEGDLVITLKPVGTWSGQVVCPADHVLKIPKDTPPQQAAMLKVNPLTAWCMLTQICGLPKGSWVVQNASNSGVGTCVIQIAKLLGLRTINLVRRKELVEPLMALGADHVLLDDPNAVQAIRSITGDNPPALALNAVGGDSALRLMDALAVKGIHVTYGAMSRRSLKVPNQFLIFKRIQLQGFWVTEWIKETDAALVADTYQQLAQWIIEGKLCQPVDSTFPLAEVKTALERAMQDQRDGKVLLQCTPD